MSVVPLIRSPSIHNPVTRAELQHQRYLIANGRSGNLWISLAGLMLIPALLISLALTVGALLNPFVPLVPAIRSLLGGSQGIVFFLMYLMNVVLYPVVTLVMLALSLHSISREKVGNTWDTLRLTNMDARQIVLGKWWASLRSMGGDQVMVALLRFGVSAEIILLLKPLLPATALPPELIYMPLLIGITIGYTVLDAALTAALGILAGVPEQANLVVVPVVIGLRVVITVCALGLTILTFVSMLGGGILYLALTLVGWIIFGLLIWGVLRAAQAFVH